MAGATIGAVALVTTHGTGPMLAFLIFALVFVIRPARIWRGILVADRRLWLAAAVTVLVVSLTCVAWIGYAHPAAIGEPTDPPPTVGDYLIFQVLWLFEAIAVFPTVTEYPTPLVYALWGLPLLCVLGLLFRTARGRLLLAVLTSLVLLVAIPTAFTAATYADTGLAWQGRYSLPLWVGLTSVAAFIASSRHERLPTLVPVIYAMAAAAVAVSVVEVGLREERGVLDPPAAHIPGGFVLVGALALGGVLLPLVLPRSSVGGLPRPGGEDPSRGVASADASAQS